MNAPRITVRIVLFLSLFVVALGTALATAFAAVGLYFFATGGSQLVVEEFSGRVAAARRISGEKAPQGPLMIFIGGMVLGFPLGIGLWKRAVRRSGRVDETEIANVLRL